MIKYKIVKTEPIWKSLFKVDFDYSFLSDRELEFLSETCVSFNEVGGLNIAKLSFSINEMPDNKQFCTNISMLNNGLVGKEGKIYVSILNKEGDVLHKRSYIGMFSKMDLRPIFTNLNYESQDIQDPMFIEFKFTDKLDLFL